MISKLATLICFVAMTCTLWIEAHSFIGTGTKAAPTASIHGDAPPGRR